MSYITISVHRLVLKTKWVWKLNWRREETHSAS